MPGKNHVQLVMTLLWAMSLAGCVETRHEIQLSNPYSKLTTVAVVPTLNFSGTGNLDTLKVTDILYSELQQVEGFAVIPVNRILAQMSKDGISTVENAQQALKLASELGAEIIIVSAITEYNPYYPPIVGIAVQLYGFQDDPVLVNTIDPVAMARSASPLKLNLKVDRKYWPKNQVQRIYNSRDKRIRKKVKRFAKARGTQQSPYQWELYLRSQEYYLRFVCYQTIRELLDKEVERINQSYLSDPEKEKEFN